MTKKHVICIIPARKNSKGIKNKNIKKINGKELIKYPFELAHNSKYIDEVIFSSDSNKYINILKKSNISKNKTSHFLLRPKELAQDNSSSYSVINHALKKINNNVDIVVLLEPTSPLTTKKDLDMGIQKLLSNNSQFDSVVALVSNPKFNSSFKVEINKNNKIIKFSKNIRYRRQKILDEFVLAGNFYISRKDNLFKNKNFISKRTYGFIVSKKYYTDIDDYIDLKYADFLLKFNEIENKK